MSFCAHPFAHLLARFNTFFPLQTNRDQWTPKDVRIAERARSQRSTEEKEKREEDVCGVCVWVWVWVCV